MNRRDFIRQIVRQGCYLHRHGSRHDIYINPATGKKAPVPRHTDIRESLCELIRKQLGIEPPE